MQVKRRLVVPGARIASPSHRHRHRIAIAIASHRHRIASPSVTPNNLSWPWPVLQFALSDSASTSIMIDASARPACSPAPARTPPALQHWLVQFRLGLLQSVLCCDSRTTRPASPAERLVRILRLCRPTTAHRVPAAGHRVAAAGVPGPGRDGRFELQDRVTLEKHVQIMWGRASVQILWKQTRTHGDGDGTVEAPPLPLQRGGRARGWRAAPAQ